MVDERGAGRFAAPEAYTPKHLAERILTSKAALEGERKQVTVLFADLKSSLELLADRDPEEARKILDPVLEHMMEAVHRYEGTVNQVMGDGIMALFGAPIAHEDHAVRACYAALRMQESVKGYADGVRRAEGVPIRIRVGLNSGDVLVRAIGSDLHMDYTALGQTTHLAARMEQMADPGSILLTADTYDLAEGFIQVKPLGPIAVRGLGRPIEVYEVTGAEAARSRLQASARRGLSRFVGRDPEVEQLHLALDRAQHGHGQLVAVVGEAGVGKSRLYWEFSRSQAARGCLVVESRSVSYGKATSYLPVIDLLKVYFDIEPRDDRRRIREKVTGKLLNLDEALRPALPALLALLDVSSDDATWQALDPSQRRQRTLEAIKHLLFRESQEQPLVVIFEDLHWIDSETQALLDALVESVPTARLLLLVNYRPEYQHRWGGKTYYRQIQIAPLAAEDAGALLDALLGSDRVLEPLKALLISQTAGNPFFLEETVRTLIETEVLVGEAGRYRMAKDPSAIQIPSTVQAVVAARVDRLSPEEKRVLQCAAVIGKDVPFALLEAIAELEEPELRSHVAALLSAEFLYEARLFPDTEYTFKHALTQEVVSGGLTAARRRTLEVFLVQAIERLFAERIDEHIETLANHAFRGELWEKAAIYLKKASEKAAKRVAYQQVVADLERALVALGHLPTSRETLEQFVDFKLMLRAYTVPLGDPSGSLLHATDALGASERLADPVRIALSEQAIAQSLGLVGRVSEAMPHMERALPALRHDRSATLRWTNHLAGGHWLLGNYREARRLFLAALEMLRTAAADSASPTVTQPWGLGVSSRVWFGFVLAELGDFDEALQMTREASELAAASGLVSPLASLGTPWVAVARGDVSSVIPALERGLALSKERNSLSLIPPYMAALGRAHTLAGRASEATGILNEAIALAEVHNRANRALFLTYLSEAYLDAAQPEEATRAAQLGLTGARERKERGEEAWSLRALADAAVHGRRPDTAAAESHYRDAVALGEELGMRPLVARCHAGLASVYRQSGKRLQSDDHFSTAITMYREMGMTYWLEKAEQV